MTIPTPSPTDADGELREKVSSTLEHILSHYLREPDVPLVMDIDALVALVHTETVKAALEARRLELADAFREFSKDVPFDERLAYYDNRMAVLKQGTNHAK